MKAFNHNGDNKEENEEEEDNDDEIHMLIPSPSSSEEDDDDDENEGYFDSIMKLKCHFCKRRYLILFVLVFYLSVFIAFVLYNNNRDHGSGGGVGSTKDLTNSNIFPNELLLVEENNYEKKHAMSKDDNDSSSSSVYSLEDLQNDAGIAVPYWQDVLTQYDIPIQEELYYEEMFGGGEEQDGVYGFNDEIYGGVENQESTTTPTIRTKSSTSNITDTSTATSGDDNDTLDEEKKGFIIPHLGPCYLPQHQKDMDNIQWSKLINDHFHEPHEERNISYPMPYMHGRPRTQQEEQKQQQNLENYCRPGFIIIGAGKCGTSSLYHYLVGHDRVMPAKDKQIHYFKYFTKRPMSWYLSHFYSAKDFLSSGGLMTGEASPGYLPYPDVAHRIQVYMKNNAGNGYKQPVSIPKIITIVRNPLERSYSSYNYNYIQPNLAKIKKGVMKAVEQSQRKFHKFHKGHSKSDNDSGGIRHHLQRRRMDLHHANRNDNDEMIETIISKNMTDEKIIDTFFFSFNDLIQAELKLLKKCLKKGGDAESGAKHLYGHKAWAKRLFTERMEHDNKTMHTKPPLMTLDESCYGGTVSSTVPRIQWKKLVELHPKKMINVQNLHLVQSMVGRSLYSLPLEWWYELYPKKDLFLVCNEDLKFQPSETMSEVSEFLGLPKFNFENVVDQGLYNVGGHEGYDKVTDWKSVANSIDDGIPISDEVRKKYLAFVKPYNERLFQMTGTSCNW